MKNSYELRMYGLVPYNISPIQQGIQFGHSVVEAFVYFDKDSDEGKQLIEWSKYWKTFIILNGGTTNNDIRKLGSLNQHLITLRENGIKYSWFQEEDLGNQLTSITLIVDERVFNYTKYPSYESRLNTLQRENPMINYVIDPDNYYKNIFGPDFEKILFLRNFLKDFKLA